MPDRRVIGVDMGGTKLLAGVVDAELSVHHRSQLPVRGLSQRILLDTVHQAVRELIESADGEVAAVGFGIPSLIDRRTGTSVVAVNLELTDLPFGEVMSERLGVPCFVDNDANMAALAEHRAGAARGASEVVLVTLGTGIGGGLILNDRLYHGALGAGAELGHMVIQIDGPRCQGNCPNHGCFEAMASGTALEREARRIGTERPQSGLGAAVAAGRAPLGPIVTELAHDGDAAAQAVLDLIGTRLGVACASFVNIFNPEVIVVGGGVIAAGERLLAPARTEMRRRALPPGRDTVAIVAAHHGIEAGMLGAAVMAWDELAAREVRA
ncbi:MAG TPA: ROK family protein [Solirubrobacteraceae bacterium]|nr:ROK family protein [Solirubrobacteraceae bacterium]